MDEQLEKLVRSRFGLNEFEMARAVQMTGSGMASDIGAAAGYVKASTSQIPRGRPSGEEAARRHSRNVEAGARITAQVYAEHPDLAHAIASAIDNRPRMAL